MAQEGCSLKTIEGQPCTIIQKDQTCTVHVNNTTFRCVIDNMVPTMVYTAHTDITKFSDIIPSLARGFKWLKIVGTKQVGLNFEHKHAIGSNGSS